MKGFSCRFATSWFLITAVACTADLSWSRFATSQLYSDFKLVTSQDNFFLPQHFSKEIPLVWARMECSRLCASSDTCAAFNFFEKAEAYVCERLEDNLCSKKTSRILVPAAGYSVWDKLSPGQTGPCLDPSSPMSCALLRPGCLGTWPSCYSCVKHCIDCQTRYSAGGDFNCTFWPDGDSISSVPVFGTCSAADTFIMRRLVNPSTGQLTMNYSLSLLDMYRVASLGAYRRLTFRFSTSTGTPHYSIYLDPVIDVNGTLSNVRFETSYPTGQDVLNLHGQRLGSTPFVHVIDDKYACGSLWAFDSNNATYCPGGSISVLGSLGTQNATKTGMRWPTFSPVSFIIEGSLKFAP